MASSVNQFRERILGAGVAGLPLRLRGSGSKDWYGNATTGTVLDTRVHRGIVAYEPTELVLTARCGTPLAEIEAALDERGQMLAFEPPHFGPGATLGGMLACALSGPRRQAVGAVRDFVLGAQLMNGRGEVLRFGGQVMKNVAGYDVSRLLAGSLGTLGLILEASIKVLPKPVAETTLLLEMGQQQALDALNAWAGQPLPLSASVWHDGALTLRLSGAQAAVKAARQRLGGQDVSDADVFWRSLREQNHHFFGAAERRSLWRFSLPSTAPALAFEPAQPQLIEWGGAQRWLASSADPATMRALASEHGGHATLFRGDPGRAGAFGPLEPAVMAIHRHLKQVFDPCGVFNPGRMYQEL
jgi:glycolate oxidase FAD binding subunit